MTPKPKDIRLNHGRRLDYTLSVSAIENPYISAVSAHGAYFSSNELTMFLLRILRSQTTGVNGNGL